MLLAAAAASRSCAAPAIGVSAAQAGAATDQAALSTKVSASSAAGVARSSDTTAAKPTMMTVMSVSSTSRNRRGSTMSTSTPAGRVKMNIGRKAATCTSDTARGSALRLVISQAEAASDMAMPVRPSIVAAQMRVNGRLSNTAHAERGHSSSARRRLCCVHSSPAPPSDASDIGAPRAHFQGAFLLRCNIVRRDACADGRRLPSCRYGRNWRENRRRHRGLAGAGSRRSCARWAPAGARVALVGRDADAAAEAARRRPAACHRRRRRQAGGLRARRRRSFGGARGRSTRWSTTPRGSRWSRCSTPRPARPRACSPPTRWGPLFMAQAFARPLFEAGREGVARQCVEHRGRAPGARLRPLFRLQGGAGSR